MIINNVHKTDEILGREAIDVDFDESHQQKQKQTGREQPLSSKRCTLTCFTPDGSPLQGIIVDIYIYIHLYKHIYSLYCILFI